MFHQCFTWSFLRDALDRLENRFDRAELGNEVSSRFVTDSRYAWHVIRRVPDEREIIDDSLRRYAESVIRVLDTDPLFLDRCGPTASRVQQPDSRSDELLEVFVARDDHDVGGGIDALGGECADHVIGFVSLDR